MRHVMTLSAFLGLATLAHVPATAQVANPGQLGTCDREAAECLKKGGTRNSCQARIDECLSRNACEVVYASCLELMEIDESVTEADCRKKRAACVKKRTR